MTSATASFGRTSSADHLSTDHGYLETHSQHADHPLAPAPAPLWLSRLLRSLLLLQKGGAGLQAGHGLWPAGLPLPQEPMYQLGMIAVPLVMRDAHAEEI